MTHDERPSDRHRPLYHFTPPHFWMNDPNGLIQWNGIYHLFYQHNPFGSLWGNMHWGHAISSDLVHWEHLPIALAPDADGPDDGGCFSGVAINADGTPTLIYTGVRKPDHEPQVPCLATSDDPYLRTWTKFPGNPVIAAPPEGIDAVIFRDHTVWREDGVWYQGVGSGIPGEGGTVLVYRSTDLLTWEYLHPLVVGDATQTEPFPTGTGWECPDFFRIDGRSGLIFASHGPGGLNVAWLTGDYADQRLLPAATGLVDAGPSFYAPQSFTDDAGRRVMIGWLRERRADDAQVADGWSGAMTLPRLLSISEDGTLQSTPAPEIDLLRGGQVTVSPADITEDGSVATVSGDLLELLATFAAGSDPVGLIVRRDAATGEQVTVTVDPAAGNLVLDTTGGSDDPCAFGHCTIERVRLVDGEPIVLRVFVDRSVIEVFVNDRIAVSDRVYPLSHQATGVAVIGGDALQSLDAWPMMPLLVTDVLSQDVAG
ncbi:MAG: glycoside hydrolase family 32 protein [Thermomicrobiales bacterium]